MSEPPFRGPVTVPVSRLPSPVYRLPETSTTTATNRAAPMIDQRKGNGAPATWISNGSGKPIRRAIHEPSSAPMKPSAMETRQPPCVPPAIARPIAPAIAAISR